MTDKYISSLHIQKLGHNILEIRERALKNIISKLDNGFVYDNDLARCKEILQKLFDWFLFEQCTCEDEVLKLIKRIFQTNIGHVLLKQYGFTPLISELRQVRSCVEPQYFHAIDEIIKYIEEQSKSNNPVPPLESEFPLSYRSENVSFGKKTHVDTTATPIEGYIYNKSSKDPQSGVGNDDLRLLSGSLGATEATESDDKNVTLPYFTLCWQSLISTDRHVLESVENSLKNYNQPAVILHTCEFFVDVMLHDFPPEVFLQRPTIIKELQKLFSTVSSFRMKAAILTCYIKLTQSLQVRINYYSDPCIQNWKQYNFIPALQSTQTSPNSFTTRSYDRSSSSSVSVSHEDIGRLKTKEISIPTYSLSIIKCILDYFNSLPNFKDVATSSKKQMSSNLSLQLINELINLLSNCLGEEMWQQSHNANIKFILQNFRDTLDKFGDVLYSVSLDSISKDFDSTSRLMFVSLLNSCLELLKHTVPMNRADEILTKSLKNALSFVLLDSTISTLYPGLHSTLLEYVKSFGGRYENDTYSKYHELDKIYNSMKSAIKIIKKKQLPSFTETIHIINESLISLHYHRNFSVVKIFIDTCANRVSLSNDQEQIIEEMLVYLLSHSDIEIKSETYRLCKTKVVAAIGPKLNLTRTGIPGSHIIFLLRSAVIIEIVINGLSSENTEIQQCSEDILIHLLKCRILVADEIWNKIVETLILAFPVLSCFVDKDSLLGRTTLNIFDPDKALAFQIPSIAVFKGNLTFLFNKDPVIRSEAVSRLCWLLSLQEQHKLFLPRLNNISNKALNTICCTRFAVDVNKPQPSEHYYQASSLQQVLELLNSDSVEPVIRRSALTQISVMMEDLSLHSTFLEKNGIRAILRILKSALNESCYKDYPDSAIPAVSILKNLSLNNSSVRQELSNNFDLYYLVLRALYLYSTDDRMTSDGSILLFSLLFGDFIKGTPTQANFSLPNVLNKLEVPLKCNFYISNINEKIDILHQDKHCFLSLKILWNSIWFGGFKELLAWTEPQRDKDFNEFLYLTEMELRQVQSTSLEFCVNNCFLQIQNCSNHESVIEAIVHLIGYTTTYLSINSNFVFEDEFLSLPWEKAFSKYLNICPASHADGELLLYILRCLQIITPLYEKKGSQNWMLEEFSNPVNPFLDILKISTAQNSEIKQLNQEVLNLITTCVKSEQRYSDFFEESPPKIKLSWIHIIEIISENLKLNETQHFYNLAYLDCLLSCLVHLTSSLGWSQSEPSTSTRALLFQLTMGLCELIGTFHCGKGPSASASVMGLSITRNAVLILNHLLMEMQYTNVKDWESCFTEEESGIENNLLNLSSLWSSRDVVLRAAIFQLFTGLFTSKTCIFEIVEGLKIRGKRYLREILIEILLDQDEASLVREHVANTLANYIQTNLNNAETFEVHPTAIGDFLSFLETHNFYKELETITSALFTLNKLNFDNKYSKGECTSGRNSDLISITTPGLLKSLGSLLCNIMVLSPQKVTVSLLEYNLIKLLFRSLTLPNVQILTTKDLSLYCNIIEMNISICTLLTKAAKINPSCSTAILNTRDCLNVALSLLNVNLYHKVLPQLIYLRNKLWSKLFNFLGALLDNPTEDGNSSEAVEILLSESVQERFLQTLCESISNNESIELQQSALCSLTSLLKIQSNSPENTARSKSIQDLLDKTTTPRTDNITENLENISPNFELHLFYDRFNKMASATFSEKGKAMAGAELCRILLQILELTNLKVTKQNVKKKSFIVNSLTNVLGVSQEAKKFALENGLLEMLLKQLKDLHFKLSVETTDSLRRISDKKRLGPVLNELGNFVILLNNFMLCSIQVKNTAAGLGLADLMHKYWNWFCALQTLLVDVLKMLCTFTTDCCLASQSLSVTSSVAGVGPKRNPSNTSLVHAIIALISKEMDLISRTHDLTVLKLCFHLLHNSCSSIECRTIIAKTNLLQSTTRLHPCITKKQKPWQTVEIIWLEFLQTFSSYQEGQASIAKFPEVLELIITLTGSNKTENKYAALIVLRNISFYPSNRPRLLACSDFLKSLNNKLSLGTLEEINMIVTIIWSLAANNQKGKLMLKCAGIDTRLHQALKIIHLSDEFNNVEQTDLERMHYVLKLLRENDR